MRIETDTVMASDVNLFKFSIVLLILITVIRYIDYNFV